MQKLKAILLLVALLVVSVSSGYAQWAPNPQPPPATDITTLSRVSLGANATLPNVRLLVSQNNQPSPTSYPVIRWSLNQPSWAGQVGIITNPMINGFLTNLSPISPGDVVLAAGTKDTTWNNDLIITNRHANGRIRFGTATTASIDIERMTINSIGRVGMGTAAPLDHLHLHEITPNSTQYPVMRLSYINNGQTYFGQLGMVSGKMFNNDRNYMCYARGKDGNPAFLSQGDLVMRVGDDISYLQDIILANRCGHDGRILFSTTREPGDEDTVRMQIDHNGVVAMGNPPNPWDPERWKVWMEGPAEIGSGKQRGSLSLISPEGDPAHIYHIDNYEGRFRLTSGDVKPADYTERVSILEATDNGNVLIGGVTPLSYSWLSSSSFKLQVNGSIRAKEILVETAGWPDFVFASDYDLPSLEEVEQHIKDNQHLPGIPSAAEMESGGVKLGEMQAKLLQKVEELTLYVIEQNKKINEQQERIQTLETQLHGSK